MRRKLIGVSQECLARSLCLTFQQVQKYERGTNRVSSSKLYEIARALSVTIDYFFEGLAEPSTAAARGVADSGADAAISAFLITQEGAELAQLFPKLSRRKRVAILSVIRADLDEGQGPEAANQDDEDLAEAS